MANVNWTDGSDNWTTSGDWSSGHVPGPGDNVTIGQGAPQVTTNVGTVTSVTNSSTLNFVDGGMLTTSSGFSNSGVLNIDDTGFGQGGSKLSVSGGLVNGGTINLGNAGLSSSDAISAATISNTGTISVQGNGANQALLDITTSAGFGSAGIVTGVVNLGGNALVEFASGQITTIAGGATLGLYAGALIADAGSTTSNSALSGLTSVGGTLYTDDNTIVTSGGLTNTGTVDIDNNSYGDGGTHLTISGTLANSGAVNIGNAGLSISDEVKATALSNTGTISVQGNGANQALLDITTSAGFGSAGIVTGVVNLGGNAEIEFASGQITTIAGGATLGLYAGALIADSGSTTSNSALFGLTSVGGTLYTDDNTIVTSGGLTNTGTVDIDNNSYGDGGTHLTISGALTNSGAVNIGNAGLSISDEVSATSLSNTGTISVQGNGANQALLDITTSAGFGSAGIVTGVVNLGGNALVEFASGQITTIAGGATLGLYAGALIADAGSTTSNSALSGLTSVGGTLYTDDNTIVTSGGLTNTGTVDIDNNSYGDGGTHLTISGTLANSGAVNIGNAGLSISDEVKATALSNTGTISVQGNGANQALLDITTSAGFGSAGIVTGTVNLNNNAVIEFASGQITTIAAGAGLGINGANAFVADAGSTTSNSALTGLKTISGTLATNDTAIVTSGGLTNTGAVDIDNTGYGFGGSVVTISGTLTNSGAVNIGNNGLSISDEVKATGLSNTGTITLQGNGANQALLDITTSAGFGSAGVVTGTVNLNNNAVIEFASGQIATIAAGAGLGINGANAFVADAGSTTSNSALAGLKTISGTLATNDTTIVTSGGLTNNGAVDIDNTGYGFGGSMVTISGTLTNSGTVNIGNNGLSISDEVKATGLSNTGSINLQGNAANQALLDITAAAGFGSAGVVSGTVNLGGNAEIEFASGQITTIAGGASLGINGANAFVADAGSTTSNSALSGLTTVSGTLATNDTAIVTSGGLTNTGTVDIDNTGYGFGGSDLTVGGTLGNASTINVGNNGLSISDVVSAHGLTNIGTIQMQGAGANQTLLKISGVADNIGSLYLSAESAVTVAGTFEQDPSGILGIGLAGTTAGQFATVTTTGNVDLLGGTLDVVPQGITLAAGQTFNLMTFTPGDLSGIFNTLEVSGNFGNGTTVNLGGGLTAGLVYNDALGEVQLQIVAGATNPDFWTAATGNWSTSADWSGGTPTFLSNVMIGSGPTANVTLSNDASINSLTIGASEQLTTTSGTDLSIGAGVAVGSGGSLSVGGEAFVDSSLANSGTVSVIRSILDIRGATSGPGNYVTSNGAILELAGGGTASASQFTDTSGATLDFAGGTFALSGGGASLGGTTEIAGGTVDLTGNLTVSAFEQSTNGVLSGTGLMTVTGAASFTTTDGSFAAPEGIYELGSGTTLLEGVSTLSGQNTSTGSAYSFNLDGGRILENQGTFNWTGGYIFLGANVGGGIIQNDSGGVFDIESDRTIFKGVSGTDQVINSGTFEKTLTTGVTHIQDHFINTGLLVVKTGTLEFDGVFTDSGTGTVVVSSGATLDLFGGGSTTSGAITVLSGGTLILSNGTQVSGATDDGLVLVESGGVAVSTVVSSGGVETVSSAGVASATMVASGGVVKVYAHGATSGSIISNGGVEYVFTSGAAVSDAIQAGGTEVAALGGLISAARVNGAAPVSAGGLTSAVTLVGGGSERVSSGGKAVATIISSGGVETALFSGVVSGAIISNSGSLVVSSGGLVSGTTILSGGGQHVSSGGVATGTIVSSSGTDYVLASGADSGATVSSGGVLLVSSGGETFAAIVSSGGGENISSGGVATGTNISAGGVVRVSSGGTASGSIISSGGAEYLFSSGVAVGDTVRAGGTQAITSGGVTSLTLVSGGAAPVSAGGVASNATLVAGGTERVSSGGKAVGTIISSGGTETVLSSGVVSNVNVSSGGSLVISSGGLASATAVLSGGGEHISAGGVATGTIVSSGGTDYVLSSGLASGATLSAGGSMLVSLGGTASATVISSGGSAHISSGGSDSGTVISGGGTDYVLSGGNDSGATLLGGALQVSGGAAVSAVVSSGGIETVISSGGLASGTQVSSGGQLRISSGATGSASVISAGGVEYLISGVSIADVVRQGATEAVLGGSIVSALISGGADPISAGGLASAVTLIAGGTQRVSSGGTANGTLISSGGTETVLSSGTANAAVVLSGGALVVSSGGVVSGGFTLSGGTATISAPVAAGQTVSFVGAGGVLALALTTSSSFAAAISGFNLTTQKIDLLGFAYASATESAVWAQSGTSGTLTVTDGGQVAVLDLIGGYNTSNFVLSTDGHGGTYVVDPPLPKPTPTPHATFVQAMATFGAGAGLSDAGSPYASSGGSGLLGAVPLVPAATGSGVR